MKRMLAVIVALTAIAMLGDSTAQAQNYAGGYQFGAGLNSQNGGCLGRSYTPREQPPYFAQYPPVYYSEIVPRPYGISPYAAPAGIAPVEMGVPVIVPQSVKNPFFSGKVENVSKESEKPAKAKRNNTTMNRPIWITNPHLNSERSIVGLSR